MYNDMAYIENGEISGVFYDVIIDIGGEGMYLNVDAYQPADYAEPPVFMTISYVNKESNNAATYLKSVKILLV